MATYTSNYAWTKPSGGDPVDIEVLNDNLDDQDSIVHQAFLDLAPVFSTANTYAVKDVVLYDNKVWICHTAVTTAGAWTGSTNWTRTTVGETGGVATYADLPDKPSINGNELSGNKTGAQLGLQNTLAFDNVPTANSTNPVKSGGIYSADEAIRKWTTAEAKSVSGNPITLLDGSARNAEGLSVTCNPKQNLHGYDHPWAAGAGKNKLPMVLADIKSANTGGTWSGNAYTLKGVTFTVLTDADENVTGVKVTGTASADTTLIMLFTGVDATQYTLTGCPSSGSTRTYFLDTFGTGISRAADTGSGVSFTANGTEQYVRIGIISGYAIPTAGLMFYPMIRLASVSDATFEPYSNECPITGYTECVVDTLPNADYIPFFEGVKNGTHGFVDLGSLNWTYESNTTRFYSDAISDLNTSDWQHPENAIICGKLISNNTPITDQSVDKSIAFYTNKRIYVVDSAYTDTETFTTAMSGVYLIYELATPTTPSYTIQQWIALVNSFNGNDANITLGTTVYGGSVGFKTGKATVTLGIVDMGDLGWSYQSQQDRFIVNVPTMKRVARWDAIYLICSVYGSGMPTSPNDNVINANDTNLYVRDTSYNGDVSAFKTAVTGQKVCYELATPTELTLTPAELELLKGYNYITTNGTTIALAYLPDSLLAEAENYVDEALGAIEKFEIKNVTGTTDANGLLITGLLARNYVFIGTLSSISIYITSINALSDGTVRLRFINADGTPCANQPINIGCIFAKVS